MRSAFFLFTTNELGFQPEFLGALGDSIASLVGVWLFQRFLKTIPFRVILVGYRLLSGLGMTMLLLVTHSNRALGIDDHWFGRQPCPDDGTNCVYAGLGASRRLCPPGVEAIICHVDVRLESGRTSPTNSGSANALARDYSD